LTDARFTHYMALNSAVSLKTFTLRLSKWPEPAFAFIQL